MTLRTKFTLYLAGMHLVLGVAAFFILVENRALLFLVEGLFLVLLIGGIALVRALFVPLDLIRTGAELISERDFSSRSKPCSSSRSSWVCATCARCSCRSISFAPARN